MVNAITDERSRNSSSTTIASGIRQGLDNELIEGQPANGVSVEFVDTNVRWAAELLRPSSVNAVASGSPEAAVPCFLRFPDR